MSCPTAARWFVDDREYFANESDYALVGRSEKLIRREIDEGNNRPFATYPDGSLVPIGFDIYFAKYRHPTYRCYDFAGHGRMLWADVDETKPEHKAEMKKILGEHTLSKAELDDRYKAVLEDEISHFIQKHSHNLDDDITDAEKEKREAHKARSAIRAFYASIENGELDFDILFDLVLKDKEPEWRQRLIELITDQTQSSVKRPLMILLGIFDDMRNPNPGEKTGYVVGYDVVKRSFICKPFFSDKDHHPLTSSWYENLQAKYPDDNVIFALAPEDLVENFLKKSEALTHKRESGVLKEVQPTESERDSGLVPYLDTSDDELYPYVLLTRTIAAEFVDDHWAELIGFDPRFDEDSDVNDILRDKLILRKAVKNITGALEQMRIPLVAKREQKDKRPCLCATEEMEWQLEEHEANFRDSALTAKEEGDEKVAENAAKLYEKIMGLLKAFNEDPEKEI